MTLIPSLLIAASIFDFLPATIAPVQPGGPRSAVAASGSGELTVQLEDASTVGAVPPGATNVPMGILNLSASCDADVTVRSIELTHVGMGSSADISAVYLSMDYRRISRSQRFNRSNSRASVVFRSFVIKRCDAVRLNVFVTIASNADPAGEHGIVIRSPSDVSASSLKVTLLEPDASRRVVTSPVNDSTITVHFLPVHSDLLYGRVGTLARLQFSSDALGAHLLKRITLTNQGDARNYDFTQLRLEMMSGTVLTNIAAGMQGNTLTLDFTPSYILHRSDSIVLLLKGIVHASWRRTIDFSLEENSDLSASSYRGN
jgi:hypothetical protein